MNTTTNTDINIVRLTKGERFVRYEIARGCSVATRHSSQSEPTTLDLDEARDEIRVYMAAGWVSAAV